jgi:hypothetical protein
LVTGINQTNLLADLNSRLLDNISYRLPNLLGTVPKGLTMKLIYTIAIDDTSKAYKAFEEWHDIILCGVNLTDQSLGIYRDYTNNKVSFTVDVSADTSKQRFEVRGRYLRAFFERFGHFIDSNDIQVSIKVTD